MTKSELEIKMSTLCLDKRHESCVGRFQCPAGFSLSIPWEQCECKCHARNQSQELSTTSVEREAGSVAGLRWWTCDSCKYEFKGVDPTGCPVCNPYSCPFCGVNPEKHDNPALRDEMMLTNHDPGCYLAADGSREMLELDMLPAWNTRADSANSESAIALLQKIAEAYPDDPGTSGLDADQFVNVRMTLGEVRLARQLVWKEGHNGRS